MDARYRTSMLLHHGAAAGIGSGGGMYDYKQQDSSHMLHSVGADVTSLLIAIFISGSAVGVHQCAV